MDSDAIKALPSNVLAEWYVQHLMRVRNLKETYFVMETDEGKALIRQLIDSQSADALQMNAELQRRVFNGDSKAAEEYYKYISK